MTELVARVNPEFLRGWRAEVTRVRLAVTLALSGGVAWCIQLAWSWQTLGIAASAAFAILSFVVTPIRIVGAIAEEHNRHTWQRQRMSALSPVQLMLGKAFGSTGLTDLAALCALVFWGLGTWIPADSFAGMGWGSVGMNRQNLENLRADFPLDVWLMVCLNLLARFLALALAIRNCDRSRVARGRSSVVAILLALLLGSPLLFLREELTRGFKEGLEADPQWFGFLPMSSDLFWAASGLLFTALVAFWCWCAVRETLGTARFAAEAAAIGLGMGLWWGGSAFDAEFALAGTGYGSWQTAAATMLLVLVAISYLWGVAERVDRRKAREFAAAPSLRAAPPWALTVLLAAGAAAAYMILAAFQNHDEGRGFVQLNFWAIGLLGFAVRDIGILLLVLTGRVKRWPELAALASWLVLGFFLPVALAGAEATVAGFDLYMLFSLIAEHDATSHLLAGVISAWLQAGLTVLWLVRRCR